MSCPRVQQRIACTEGSCQYPYSEACFHPSDLEPGEDPGHAELLGYPGSLRRLDGTPVDNYMENNNDVREKGTGGDPTRS